MEMRVKPYTDGVVREASIPGRVDQTPLPFSVKDQYLIPQSNEGLSAKVLAQAFENCLVRLKLKMKSIS
jgi:hypothetical protein